MLVWVIVLVLPANGDEILQRTVGELLQPTEKLPVAGRLNLPSTALGIAPLTTSLENLDTVLGQRLLRLQGGLLQPLGKLDVGAPLSSLLLKSASNCSIRSKQPFAVSFGTLMPAEPSANSVVNYHFTVDCKRPATYRIVVIDNAQQLIFAPFLPARVAQADGTFEAASLLLSLNGKPLGSQFRNNGVNPSHHELSAELRTQPDIPVTPFSAGKIQLDVEKPSVALIEVGFFQTH